MGLSENRVPRNPKVNHDLPIFVPLFGYISGMYHDWLVVLIVLKNISQWEGLSHILWKIKHVWNHQPDDIPWYTPIFRHGLMGIAPCPPNGACMHVATSDRCDRWCPVGAPHQAEATAPAPAVARSILFNDLPILSDVFFVMKVDILTRNQNSQNVEYESKCGMYMYVS